MRTDGGGPKCWTLCIAAPQSHRLLFKNDVVRVLEVGIEPGVREPVHTHRFQSIMIIDPAGAYPLLRRRKAKLRDAAG
jgi:hypothetical protein